MDKKLSELWLEQKKYLDPDFDGMYLGNVKIYGHIIFLETRYTYTSSQFAAEECERELKGIAQSHNIRDYKI